MEAAAAAAAAACPSVRPHADDDDEVEASPNKGANGRVATALSSVVSRQP
jgi:hypothetical protein